MRSVLPEKALFKTKVLLFLTNIYASSTILGTFQDASFSEQGIFL